MSLNRRYIGSGCGEPGVIAAWPFLTHQYVTVYPELALQRAVGWESGTCAVQLGPLPWQGPGVGGQLSVL